MPWAPNQPSDRAICNTVKVFLVTVIKTRNKNTVSESGEEGHALGSLPRTPVITSLVRRTSSESGLGDLSIRV